MQSRMPDQIILAVPSGHEISSFKGSSTVTQMWDKDEYDFFFFLSWFCSYVHLSAASVCGIFS